MKWALLVVLAFGVSSAAAAGFVAMKSPEETPVAADSTAVQDTAIVAEETPTREEQRVEQVDTSTTYADTARAETTNELPVAVTAAPSGADTSCPVVAVVPPEATTDPEPPAPDPEVQRQAYRQVARILSNMRDQEMKEVLVHIDNDEVEMILRNVTARDAARILSQLSGERAALLSRRLLTVAPVSGGDNR